MVKLIQTAAWLDAWVEATEFLLTNSPTLNLVLAIEEPGRRGYPAAAERRLDDFFVREEQLPMHSVAETIFPGFEYRRRGLKGVFEVYPDEIFPAITVQSHRRIRHQASRGRSNESQ